VKYTLLKKAGRTSLAELAAATAQKESAVRLALECLSKQGQITLEIKRDGGLTLNAGGRADKERAAVAAAQLAYALDESKAYRRHFREQPEINLE
jgi:DNA-binding transcriptional regulator PaaX